MKTKKPGKQNGLDKNLQKKIEKKVQIEKLNLGHPKGLERFEQAIKRAYKKKS